MSGMNWTKARDDKRIRDRGFQPHEDLLPRHSNGKNLPARPSEIVKRKKKAKSAQDLLEQEAKKREKQKRKAQVKAEEEKRKLEKAERREAERTRQEFARREKEAKRQQLMEERKKDPKYFERAEKYRRAIVERMSKITVERRSSKKLKKPDIIE